MKSPFLILLLGTGMLFSSCYRYAYYQHPRHTQTMPYREIPLQSEHRPVAVYAATALSRGESNEWLSDGHWTFTGSGHLSLQRKYLQGFAAVELSTGDYFVRPPDDYTGSYYDNLNWDPDFIRPRAGHKNFGAWGLHMGINGVIPFAKGGEWRFLGVEYNRQQEWGQYLKFRQSLPVTAANLIDPSAIYQTIGFSSDIISKTRRGSVGYKFGLVLSLNPLTYYDNYRVPRREQPGAWIQTLHLNIDRFTWYVQLNTGYRAYSLLTGLSYRLR